MTRDPQQPPWVEMATIKAIEGRSVHQIQSGQVIVDLCSVVKELVENAFDAGATSIDVRFKNYGLESIEVQDNGDGISPENFDTIALKHYTSKLSTYDDLTTLQTFGFRGEALSSLCALSEFHIVTAREGDAPKGTRLDFEISGKLKGTNVVASQKGTTVVIQNLFHNLPVRRRELEKNIKREYGKMLGMLQAYACVSAGLKFSVSNQMAKGKKIGVFATKSNLTTKDNIVNVFGAKALNALMPLDLCLEMQPTSGPSQRWSTQEDGGVKNIRILGHVSRPVFGEGRQTPDRQMFFVNTRPCGLPQVAKAFNEVYKSFNVTQSPFVFADIKMDTRSYDVNVSPDKRTILLHDQTALLESLKTALTELFKSSDQTVPQSQISLPRLPSYKQLTINREASALSRPDDDTEDSTELATAETLAKDKEDVDTDNRDGQRAAMPNGLPVSLIQNFLDRNVTDRTAPVKANAVEHGVSKEKQKLVDKLEKVGNGNHDADSDEDGHMSQGANSLLQKAENIPIPVRDFNERMAEQEAKRLEKASMSPTPSPETRSPPHTSIVQNAFDRMRPKRTPADIATITIGSKTITSHIGTPATKRKRVEDVGDLNASRFQRSRPSSQLSQRFGASLRAFAAPGTQLDEEASNDEEVPVDEAMVTDYPETSLEAEDDEEQPVSDPAIADAEDVETSSIFPADEEGSDDEYIDEDEKKAQEDAKVELMIQEAEKEATRTSQDSLKRANNVLGGGGRHKHLTVQLVATINTSVARIEQQMLRLSKVMQQYDQAPIKTDEDTIDSIQAPSAEERLSLTVSKGDFARMRIVGQFNLGFILATRSSTTASHTSQDELFIIDQHASDEKYNFERLQRTTIVQNQRLVHPYPLPLTAIEEETLLNNLPTLSSNGFEIAVDSSPHTPTGNRCKLLSLPMSKEVVFNLQDLEELLSLLAESEGSTAAGGDVLRPAKVRRMLAMRACRSSIMIGKSLTGRQMEKVVRHMGEIEKPWNCPHGRPTMRHLMGLNAWEGWRGDWIGGGDGGIDWSGYVERMRGVEEDVEEEVGEEVEEEEVEDVTEEIGEGEEEVEDEGHELI
ncbi:MAG: hypothetical protein M1836_005199 [Candelina mexicana]|nr:MAG: hypothetical protein M1836_005199 [Candelina mexicana]